MYGRKHKALLFVVLIISFLFSQSFVWRVLQLIPCDPSIIYMRQRCYLWGQLLSSGCYTMFSIISTQDRDVLISFFDNHPNIKKATERTLIKAFYYASWVPYLYLLCVRLLGPEQDYVYVYKEFCSYRHNIIVATEDFKQNHIIVQVCWGLLAFIFITLIASIFIPLEIVQYLTDFICLMISSLGLIFVLYSASRNNLGNGQN